MHWVISLWLWGSFIWTVLITKIFPPHSYLGSSKCWDTVSPVCYFVSWNHSIRSSWWPLVGTSRALVQPPERDCMKGWIGFRTTLLTRHVLEAPIVQVQIIVYNSKCSCFYIEDLFPYLKFHCNLLFVYLQVWFVVVLFGFAGLRCWCCNFLGFYLDAGVNIIWVLWWLWYFRGCFLFCDCNLLWEIDFILHYWLSGFRLGFSLFG